MAVLTVKKMGANPWSEPVIRIKAAMNQINIQLGEIAIHYHIMRWGWILSIALAGLMTGCVTRSTDVVVTSRLIDKGHVCGIHERRFQIIRDPATWMKYWSELQNRKLNQVSAPPVDFSREEVVAMNMGLQAKGDRDVEIIKVEKSLTAIRVLYTLWPLQTHTYKAVSNTSPYHVVAITRSRMPARFVEIKADGPRKAFF